MPVDQQEALRQLTGKGITSLRARDRAGRTWPKISGQVMSEAGMAREERNDYCAQIIERFHEGSD